MKYLLVLSVLLGACAHAQTPGTKLITPVSVLPKADGTACGLLQIPLANNTNPLLVNCFEINAGSIAHAFTVTGAATTDGRIVLNPGAGNGTLNYIQVGGNVLPGVAGTYKVGLTGNRFSEMNSLLFNGNNASATSTFIGLNTGGSVFSGDCTFGQSAYCLTVTGASGLTPSNLLANTTAGGAGVALQVQSGAPLAFSQNAALWVSTESEARPAAIIQNNTPVGDQAALFVVNNTANKLALFINGRTLITDRISPAGDGTIDIGIAGTNRMGAYYGKTVTLSGAGSGGSLSILSTSASAVNNIDNPSGPAIDFTAGYGVQVQSVRVNPFVAGGQVAIYGTGSAGGTSTTLHILSESGGSVSTAGGGTSFYSLSDGTHSISLNVASNLASFKINGNTVIDDARAAFVTAATISGLTSGRCVETTTGGLLTVAAAACGTGGGGFSASAWTSYTPSTTNLTSVSSTAGHNQYGKSAFFRVQVTGTSNGSVPTISLPFTAVTNNQTFTCTVALSGATVPCTVVVSSSTMTVNIYDNSAYGNTNVYTFIIQGVMETT